MKIAIASVFYPYRGGIAQFNANLINELKSDHQVEAFNFKRQYPSLLFPGKSQYVGEKESAVKVESKRVLDTINPLSYHKTAKEIEKFAPQLLLMRYWNPFFAPSLGYIGRKISKKSKVISIVDNAIPHERHFIDTPLTRYFLKGSDGFVVLSDAVGEDLLTLKSDANYITIPHPVYDHFGKKIERAEAHKELQLDPSKRTLLFFGLIREYKGLDLLIEAFSQLDDTYQLLIAGEPYGSFDKYQELIDSSPNRERIKLFTHYIEDDKVPLFFSASDLTVLPYRTATQSGISAICYHFELPLLTTDVGGLKEAVEEPGTGVVISHPNSTLLKEAIENYFKEGQADHYINNIKIEKERLSWSNFAKELLNFYHSL